VQRSGATPQGAWTTTTPVEGRRRGKREPKKEIMGIVLAHHPSYAATANPAFPEDFVRKAQKARDARGPRFLHVLAPCPPGWRFSSEETIELGRLATETGLFPLYEVEDGVYRITRKGGQLKPVDAYVRPQGRFRHWSADDVQELQRQVRAGWDRLVRLEQETAPGAPAGGDRTPKVPPAPVTA
jgi:pyruvate/2-oxoacid:ferredoxin oxidoreductase beta subunit